MIGNASPEAFYRLTVTENVFASIDTCGSALDTLLRIGSLAGSRCKALTRRWLWVVVG